MKTFALGVLAGIAIATLVFGLIVQKRAAWLTNYQFTLTQPPVPSGVLEQIRNAEANYYAGLPAWRRFVEHAQDSLAIIAPSLAYRLNLSVGRYRMKAKTVEELINWAIENGYLVIEGSPDEMAPHALAYFAEQPALSDWQASVYLEWLRSRHDGLARLSWETIARDLELIEKLYSGYMGAGGDMEAWLATMTPGPVAKSRMESGPDR